VFRPPQLCPPLLGIAGPRSAVLITRPGGLVSLVRLETGRLPQASPGYREALRVSHSLQSGRPSRSRLGGGLSCRCPIAKRPGRAIEFANLQLLEISAHRPPSSTLQPGRRPTGISRGVFRIRGLPWRRAHGLAPCGSLRIEIGRQTLVSTKRVTRQRGCKLSATRYLALVTACWGPSFIWQNGNGASFGNSCGLGSTRVFSDQTDIVSRGILEIVVVFLIVRKCWVLALFHLESERFESAVQARSALNSTAGR